jgi:hypothetical protein
LCLSQKRLQRIAPAASAGQADKMLKKDILVKAKNSSDK